MPNNSHLTLLSTTNSQDETLYNYTIKWVTDPDKIFACSKCSRIIKPKTRHAKLTVWEPDYPEYADEARIHTHCWLAEVTLLKPGESLDHPDIKPATGPPVAVLNIRKEHNGSDMMYYYNITEVLQWSVKMITGDNREEWPRHLAGFLGILEIESRRGGDELDDVLQTLHHIIGHRLESGDWPRWDRVS